MLTNYEQFKQSLRQLLLSESDTSDSKQNDNSAQPDARNLAVVKTPGELSPIYRLQDERTPEYHAESV